MRSTILPAAAAAAAAALLLAGCSAPDDQIELEFQTEADTGTPYLEALAEAAADFEAANPGVVIDVRPATPSYETDMKVRMAADDMPDIVGTHGWSLLRYSEFLEPLDDRAWAADVNPALDEAMRDDDGTLYALPVDTDVAGIVVNADVLADAGWEVSDIETWDDFAAACDDVLAMGISPITVAGRTGSVPGNLADWLAPGVYSDDELEALGDGEFVGEPYEELLGVVEQWREADYFNPDYSSAAEDDMAISLAEERSAFMFSQNGRAADALSYAPEATITYMPVPGFEPGEQYLIGGERRAFGAAADSDDLDTALEFLDFLAEPDRIQVLSSAAGSAPGLTTVEPDLPGPIGEAYEAYVVPDQLPVEPYFDRVHLPNGMWDTLVRTVDSVITGQSTPSAATAQVEADFSSLYGQAQR